MKIIAIAAAAAMISGVAYAQKSPTPQTGNLDASTERQIELQEPGQAQLPAIGDIDLGTTASVEAAPMQRDKTDDNPDFRIQGGYTSNTLDNFSGR